MQVGDLQFVKNIFLKNKVSYVLCEINYNEGYEYFKNHPSLLKEYDVVYDSTEFQTVPIGKIVYTDFNAQTNISKIGIVLVCDPVAREDFIEKMKQRKLMSGFIHDTTVQTDKNIVNFLVTDITEIK